MEAFIRTALEQAPSLTVLCLLVNLFLKRDRERDNFIRQLHDEHLAARGESREAIRENTESNRTVAKAVNRLTEVAKDSCLNYKPKGEP